MDNYAESLNAKMGKFGNTNLPPLDSIPQDLFISRYFIETCYKNDKFSFIQWLKGLDSDTVKLIDCAIDKTRKETEETAEDDSTGEDIILFLMMILCLERNIAFDTFHDHISVDELSELSGYLALSVICESLRRKGLIEFVNEGTLTDKNIAVKETGKLSE